jgi:antitoxin Phd
MQARPTVIDPLLRELPAFDASTVKNRFRDVAERAAKGAVVISRYSRPELVLMSTEEYLRLEQFRRAPLDQLTDQFEELVANMQRPKSAKAVRSLFGASPGALGRAAVKAAKANVR